MAPREDWGIGMTVGGVIVKVGPSATMQSASARLLYLPLGVWREEVRGGGRGYRCFAALRKVENNFLIDRHSPYMSHNHGRHYRRNIEMHSKSWLVLIIQ